MIQPYHSYGPKKLFDYSVSKSHTALLEVDYNLHKSNATYFADLDIARAHLASHLFLKGIGALADNANTRLILDPTDSTKAQRGSPSVNLGAVHCSFRREIKPFQPYEIWTRTLSWDRKWFYMVSYFVEADDASGHNSTDWESKVFATAVSKYVFKLGRLTIHPAIVIGASGLLPERPGGWISTNSEAAYTIPGVDAEVVIQEAGWNWQRTEAEKSKGLVYAKHFSAVDELVSQFDGEIDGVLKEWRLG